MSLRIDTAEWIAGALLIGETGLGVLGQSIPSTGSSGAGYAYNDLSLPADNAKEICGRITTWPVGLTTFTPYEDTSFVATGPDGTYSFQYQLYVDGVAVGSPATVSLNIGGQFVTPGVGTLTLNGFAPTISQTNSGGTDTSVTPGVGVLTLVGFAPNIRQFPASPNIQPGAGVLTLTGFAPSIFQGPPVKQVFRGDPNHKIAIDLGGVAILSNGSVRIII